MDAQQPASRSDSARSRASASAPTAPAAAEDSFGGGAADAASPALSRASSTRSRPASTAPAAPAAEDSHGWGADPSVRSQPISHRSGSGRATPPPPQQEDSLALSQASSHRSRTTPQPQAEDSQGWGAPASVRSGRTAGSARDPSTTPPPPQQEDSLALSQASSHRSRTTAPAPQPEDSQGWGAPASVRSGRTGTPREASRTGADSPALSRAASQHSQAPSTTPPPQQEDSQGWGATPSVRSQRTTASGLPAGSTTSARPAADSPVLSRASSHRSHTTALPPPDPEDSQGGYAASVSVRSHKTAQSAAAASASLRPSSPALSQASSKAASAAAGSASLRPSSPALSRASSKAASAAAPTASLRPSSPALSRASSRAPTASALSHRSGTATPALAAEDSADVEGSVDWDDAGSAVAPSTRSHATSVHSRAASGVSRVTAASAARSAAAGSVRSRATSRVTAGTARTGGSRAATSTHSRLAPYDEDEEEDYEIEGSVAEGSVADTAASGGSRPRSASAPRSSAAPSVSARRSSAAPSAAPSVRSRATASHAPALTEEPSAASARSVASSAAAASEAPAASAAPASASAAPPSRTGSARSRPSVAPVSVPPPPEDSPAASPGPGGAGERSRRPRAGAPPQDEDSPRPMSPSAKPKDVVNSYLRQLYGADTVKRCLAAQGLAALPSFLPRSEAGSALRVAVDTGVVGCLAELIAVDEELPVQEACLQALASLLLSTAPFEDHSAPMKPDHLRLLGPLLLRPEVLQQIAFLTKVTTSGRVVLAAARVAAIMAPYITQSNDVHVLDSGLVPALQAALAAVAPPAPKPAAAGEEGSNPKAGTPTPAPARTKADTPKASAVTPRDAAACALALMALADVTPDLHVAVRTSAFFQSLAVLYQRVIDPGQASGSVLPADAAALLLRALTQMPSHRWAGALPRGFARSMERQIEDCDALECLVSYVAVEAGNLRALGEALAAALEANAADVLDKNRVELEALAAKGKELRRELAEARDAADEAAAAAQAAEKALTRASSARVRGLGLGLGLKSCKGREVVVAIDSLASASAAAREAPRGGGAELRRRRREAETEAARAEEALMAAREALADAEAQEAALEGEVQGVRRAEAPVRWQSERMAGVAEAAQSWREQHAPKASPKVRVSPRPHLPLLQLVLAHLAQRAKPPPTPERGSAAPPGAPSPEHVGAVQAKLLGGGLVQSLVRLSSVQSALRSLALEVAALASDLALPSDMEEALQAASVALSREATALSSVNARAAARVVAVDAEAARLTRALKLGTPSTASPRSTGNIATAELGPRNSMSSLIHQHDVEKRLLDLDAEAVELEAVQRDTGALLDLLGSRLEAISQAGQALSESHARFAKAFPSQVAPSLPGKAPAPTSGGGAGPPPGPSPSPARALALACHHIMARDPSHPAGHLVPLLSRALHPVTTAASNLGALVRQLYGKAPGGGPAAAAAHDGGADWFAALAAGGVGGGSAAAGFAGAGAFGSLMTFAGPGASLLSLTGQPSTLSLGGRSGSGGGAYSPGGGRARPGSRPQSARSPAASPSAGVSRMRPMSARSGGGGYSTASPRSPRSPNYGHSVGSSGYGGGYGGFMGFPASGPLGHPTDAHGRPMRYPAGSMYHIIQSTHSPLRGYSAPNNGPPYPLEWRAKLGVGPGATGGGAGSPGGRGPGGELWAQASGASGLGPSVSGRTSPGAEDSELLFPPGALPAADESARVVQAAISSLLFDPIDPAVVLGPGAGGASAKASGSGAKASPRGVSRGGVEPEGSFVSYASAAAASSPRPGTAASWAAALPPGEGMCVLDALLVQAELLAGIMDALAGLQMVGRSCARSCRLLPASLSFASLEPGRLGGAMAALHRMWADTLPRQPDMRVPIARTVAEIAARGLVPPADFPAVYTESGMVGALVAMLAGALRPGKADAKPAEPPGAETADGESPASPSGGEGSSPSGPAPLGKSRYVGRLTAGAVPTLRLGPAQQAEQAAAARALMALAAAQPDVLAAIAADEQLLARLASLCIDHSMAWTARLAAADLLADLVLGGGPGAAAAVAAGAYAGLAEVLNRDMFPYMNQDPRGDKATVVSALGCLAAHEELVEGVVAAAAAPSGPSSGLPLDNADQVLSAILRSLWGVVQQVYGIMSSERTGHGKHVDPELVSGLTATATAAAHELAALADTHQEARRAMKEDLGLGRKINVPFLQAIKDIPLYEALNDLKKNLS
ncbi:hypothetical protein HYH03_018213 [Edaphochlamys debaryana]|uniref:Uncharacterized protein n=1 Tax=Edaphochlamys debaryana TaxID=47281 RepID=A0A835XMG6_9CHLO|nr:hypothetical protein HYH03_018213 [Edaphochlamys debaryana]|eukprot:KAG2482869.1 hypothetical protein HYH03_018213 [Edaphochlamys debaryana]